MLGTFELDLHLPAARAVQELAREEIRLAQEILVTQPQGPEHAVHEFRKSLKGLRALARLVRSSLGDEFTPCNRALRDAGRLVSALRDEEAILEALHALESDVLGEEAKALPRRLEQMLRAHSQSEETRRSLPARIDQALGALARGAALLGSVELHSYQDMRAGFWRTYESARKRYLELGTEQSDATLHELRKRVKDHRFHLQLLSPSARAALEAESETAHVTSELLGKDHDLVLLTARLGDLELGSEEAHAALHLIARERSRIQEQAFGLCEPLLEEEPLTKVARIFDVLESTPASAARKPEAADDVS